MSVGGSRRPGLPMDARSITVHSTKNKYSTAQNERDNLVRVANTRQASFHIAVDDKEAVECIPLNEVAWHAGDGYYGTGNRSSISVEICESGNRWKTLDNTSTLLADMLKQRGWGIDKLYRHYDWSGKDCPGILMANGWKEWNDLKVAVDKKLREV